MTVYVLTCGVASFASSAAPGHSRWRNENRATTPQPCKLGVASCRSVPEMAAVAPTSAGKSQLLLPTHTMPTYRPLLTNFSPAHRHLLAISSLTSPLLHLLLANFVVCQLSCWGVHVRYSGQVMKKTPAQRPHPRSGRERRAVSDLGPDQPDNLRLERWTTSDVSALESAPPWPSSSIPEPRRGLRCGGDVEPEERRTTPPKYSATRLAGYVRPVAGIRLVGAAEPGALPPGQAWAGET